MDRFPVTIANYSWYINETGFRPRDPYNWLKNWNGSTSPPPTIVDTPVTFVSLDEARAFCSWRGARLPHSYEWQYAAQGNDGRIYPWGNDNDLSKYPSRQRGNIHPGPEPVDAHLDGASPFGVVNLIGNAWEYTDESY